MGTETRESAAVEVAYLAEGKLFLAASGRKPEPIDSHFAQEMLDRQERNRQRHDWKQSGMAWNLTQQVPGFLMPNASARPIRFACLSRAREGSGELAYALQTDVVGGLFFWERKTGYERRLFHRADFEALDLACHPADGTIAVAVRMEDGAVNLSVMKADGKGLREITAGDSTDECPAWVPAAEGKHVLVYQSAGLGRNTHGVVAERGPYAVFELDTDNGEMKTLLEADDKDYLSPRVGADGSLYYITRPYQPLHPPVSPWKVARDVVLFPVGLALAFVHFFDWFSTVFRRKPLLTAGGPPKQGPDARYMMLWGKLVDAEQVHREKGSGGAGVAVVPRTWTLQRRNTFGTDETLATHVVSYDLCPDGSVIYTNGAGVYHLDPSGQRTEVCASRLIERVVRL